MYKEDPILRKFDIQDVLTINTMGEKMNKYQHFRKENLNLLNLENTLLIKDNGETLFELLRAP